MKKRKKRRSVRKLPILILLFIIAVTVTLTTPTFNIKSIEVRGNEKVLTEDIILNSGIMTGTNLFTFSKSSAIEGIKRLSYIDTVKIQRKIPKTVLITVTECELAAYIEAGNQLVGIDKKGKVLELSPKNTKPDKPLVKGIALTKSETGQIIETKSEDGAQTLVKFISKLEEYGALDNTAEIRIKSRNDIQFITTSGLRVMIGSENEIDYKFKYYQSVLQNIGEDSGGVLDLTSGSEKATYRKSDD
ncbi:MAG: FtsQ-type POTRA domain-containing protein [Clostridia bacterium]|nr:FtsQ-type POTRA domain-containing protein [Clostridia bacterium]